jgi:hypothetical protein
MSDLIQRLREWASEPACYEVPPPSLLREAADTIARLTDERDAARADERKRCKDIVRRHMPAGWSAAYDAMVGEGR